MRSNRFLQVFLLLLVVAGIAYVAFRPGEIRLIALPTPPRDAPIATSGEKKLAMTSLSDRLLLEGPELRKARNSLVEAWARALDGYGQGQDTLRTAERIELKVWIVRHQLQEIDDRAFHAAVAELLAREITRMKELATFDPPQASKAAIREAKAYLARERLLAGEKDHKYAAHRQAQLTALKDRVQVLQKQRPQELQSALDELADFEVQCPPEDDLLKRLKRG
ncbi:MAG: hypothetical protein QNJ98_16700 [Planctomycetota bacterium]|nr:hypothetical protein [Planctomycetota bacterium]